MRWHGVGGRQRRSRPRRFSRDRCGGELVGRPAGVRLFVEIPEVARMWSIDWTGRTPRRRRARRRDGRRTGSRPGKLPSPLSSPSPPLVLMIQSAAGGRPSVSRAEPMSRCRWHWVAIARVKRRSQEAVSCLHFTCRGGKHAAPEDWKCNGRRADVGVWGESVPRIAPWSGQIERRGGYVELFWQFKAVPPTGFEPVLPP